MSMMMMICLFCTQQIYKLNQVELGYRTQADSVHEAATDILLHDIVLCLSDGRKHSPCSGAAT